MAKKNFLTNLTSIHHTTYLKTTITILQIIYTKLDKESEQI